MNNDKAVWNRNEISIFGITSPGNERHKVTRRWQKLTKRLTLLKSVGKEYFLKKTMLIPARNKTLEHQVLMIDSCTSQFFFFVPSVLTLFAFSCQICTILTHFQRKALKQFERSPRKKDTFILQCTRLRAFSSYFTCMNSKYD